MKAVETVCRIRSTLQAKVLYLVFVATERTPKVPGGKGLAVAVRNLLVSESTSVIPCITFFVYNYRDASPMNTLRLLYRATKDNHPPPLLSYSAPFSTFLNNTLPPIARPSSFQSDIILACGPDTTEAELRHCDIRTVPRTTESIIHQFPIGEVTVYKRRWMGR